MISADTTNTEDGAHPSANPEYKTAELAVGILATATAAACGWLAFEPLWVAAWAGVLGGVYVAFSIVPREPTRGSETARQCCLTVLWSAAIIASAKFPTTVIGVTLSACLAQAWSALSGRHSALLSGSTLAREHAARADAETAFLQAVEEIRRLRIDVKTTANVHQQLSAALDESTSALNLVRGKADALAATLQRVMPYEPETGLLNAEKFETVLQREWSRMQRQELPLTLVAIKLDHFDEFAQAYGRMLYEAVMRRLAEVFRKAGSRPGDVAARLSRDQFVILFPEAEERHALLLAEAVRVRICQLSTPNRHAPQRLLTASLGVATIVPHADAIPSTLRERAEAALYEATFHGGNRCVRNRIAGFAKLERWNPDQDGLVTLDGLRHKLAISGYRGKPQELSPGAKPRERRVSADSVEAVVAGILKITLDGETRTLRAGDCLYLPKGVTATEEVVGSEPVVCIEGVRS